MRDKLIVELRDIKKEVSLLRTDINKIRDSKESHYKDKIGYSKKAASCVVEIKGLRIKRDELTKSVKGSKKKRDELNNKIKKLNEEINKLKKEKQDISAKHGITTFDSELNKGIKDIESQIETEVISFAKEQQLMKKLNQLRNEKKKLAVFGEVSKNLKKAYGGLKKLRKEANEAHSQTKKNAEESQKLHTKILEISKGIEGFDKKKLDYIKHYDTEKKKLKELSINFKKKKERMDFIVKELDKIKQEATEKKEKETQKILSKKEDETHDKIKRGEKLTNADLLVFQKFN